MMSANNKPKKRMTYVRFTPELILELIEFWPDPDKGARGMSLTRLAELSGLSQAAVYKYVKSGRYPDSNALRKLGEFFGVYFVEDYDQHIDNGKFLQMAKALSV